MPRIDVPPPDRSLPQHWFQILLALADEPRHGLGITQEIAARSEGRTQIWPGMLYVALKRMVQDGLVADAPVPAGFAAGGGRPRFYRITRLGRRICAAEAERLADLVETARAKRVLGRTGTT